MIKHVIRGQQDTLESVCSPHAKALRRPLLADGSLEALTAQGYAVGLNNMIRLT